MPGIFKFDYKDTGTIQAFASLIDIQPDDFSEFKAYGRPRKLIIFDRE